MIKPYTEMRQSGKLRVEVTTYPREPLSPEELGNVFDVYNYYPFMVNDQGFCDYWSRECTQDPNGEGTPHSTSTSFWERMGFTTAGLIVSGRPGQFNEFVWRGPEKTYYYKITHVEG